MQHNRPSPRHLGQHVVTRGSAIMSRTIQGTSTVGIKLTLVSDNPVTILPTGTINSPGLYAIYGSDSVAWSLINRGKLSGGHSGVTFAGTGTITNGSATATHASISG